MTVVVSEWPFLPEEKRTPEENERWWAECYFPSPAEVTLRGVTHSVIVTGMPGSGKSISLKALKKREGDHWLIVHYPVSRWPGGPHAWAKNYNHLGQMMACAVQVVKGILSDQPDKVTRLSSTNQEFLRWLVEKYSGKRAFQRWADALNLPLLLDFAEQQPFYDMYPTDTELSDVQGQIEELVTLSRRLGLAGVTILVDVHQGQEIGIDLREQMKEIFGWLTPLQFEGFAIKAALPDSLAEEMQLVEHSRGRISFTSLHWTDATCQELCHRHLYAATQGALTRLSDLAVPELLTPLITRIEAVYGEPLPRAWLQLTLILLQAYQKEGQPLTDQALDDVLRTYFAKHISLRFDKTRRGVCRGVEFIPLPDLLFRFLEVLWRYYEAEDADDIYPELLKITGKGSLYRTVNRLRDEIEPVPSDPIYLLSDRSRGYWLEHFVE